MQNADCAQDVSLEQIEHSFRALLSRCKLLRGLVPRRELRPVERMVTEEEEELHFLSCVQLCWEATKNTITKDHH